MTSHSEVSNDAFEVLKMINHLSSHVLSNSFIFPDSSVDLFDCRLSQCAEDMTESTSLIGKNSTGFPAEVVSWSSLAWEPRFSDKPQLLLLGLCSPNISQHKFLNKQTLDS